MGGCSRGAYYRNEGRAGTFYQGRRSVLRAWDDDDDKDKGKVLRCCDYRRCGAMSHVPRKV